MKHDPIGRTASSIRPQVWVFVLATLLFLYALSIGPVEYVAQRNSILAMHHLVGKSKLTGPPLFWRPLYVFADWTHTTPLLEAYIQWWRNKAADGYVRTKVQIAI